MIKKRKGDVPTRKQEFQRLAERYGKVRRTRVFWIYNGLMAVVFLLVGFMVVSRHQSKTRTALEVLVRDFSTQHLSQFFHNLLATPDFSVDEVLKLARRKTEETAADLKRSFPAVIFVVVNEPEHLGFNSQTGQMSDVSGVPSRAGLLGMVELPDAHRPILETNGDWFFRVGVDESAYLAGLLSKLTIPVLACIILWIGIGIPLRYLTDRGRRLRFFILLRTITRFIRQSSDEDKIQRTLPGVFEQAFGYEEVRFYLDKDGELTPNPRGSANSSDRLPHQERLVAEVFETNTPHADEANESIAAPISAKGDAVPLGVLWARTGRFKDRDSLRVLEEAGVAARFLLEYVRSQEERERDTVTMIRRMYETTMGVVAPVISHHVRNYLMMGDQRLTTLTNEIEDERHRAFLAHIQANIGKCFEQIDRFSKHTEMRGAPGQWVDVRRTLTSVCELHKDYFSMIGIRFDWKVARGTPGIAALHEYDFFQVMANLLINSSQAFSEQARSRSICRIAVSLKTRGDKAVIEVRDNGSGILKTDLDRIFDPDFSTKEGGGQGLVYCKRVVQGVGGEIRARSKPGIETVLTITLPIANQELSAA